eukprot:TRINITY_DN87535_c0_g1_i1.p2 TRINITY_DN87535_c0_g1~~TRINITY_DN87535_c0_g1_i1.p2  ORF type:complete len:319 (-),score=68.82 TRINITY_DN87535_c0_g1_i1:66-1022(-)
MDSTEPPAKKTKTNEDAAEPPANKEKTGKKARWRDRTSNTVVIKLPLGGQFDEDKLRKFLSKHGHGDGISEVRFPAAKDGLVFVEYGDEAAAVAAVEGTKGKCLKKQEITVYLAKPKHEIAREVSAAEDAAAKNLDGMRELVDKAVSTGSLKSGDVDERAMLYMAKLGKAIAEAALSDLALARERGTITGSAGSYLMGILRRLSSQGIGKGGSRNGERVPSSAKGKGKGSTDASTEADQNAAIDLKVVRAVVAEGVREGLLCDGDVDDRAMEYMAKLGKSVAEAALADFAFKRNTLTGNPQAFLMATMRKLQAELCAM